MSNGEKGKTTRDTKALDPAGAEIDENTDLNRLSSAQKASVDWLNKADRDAAHVGFGGAQMLVPLPALTRTGNETIMESGQSNAQIVITRDRPASIFSGYGGEGHQKCSTIDIVAGRMSQFSRTTFNTSQGEEAPFAVDPNFEFDAARIYISEKTDIDDNFNLRTQGEQSGNTFIPVQKSIGRSGIGIKADAVRIIGNEGVRIVTGVYESNSRGGKKTPAGIELVALNGNKSPFEVQPFVKGANLVSALYELQDEIANLNGILEEFILAQTSLNAIFECHNHMMGNPNTMSPALGSPVRFQEQAKVSNKDIWKVVDKLDTQARNLIRWEKVYISPESKNWILSRYNGTN